MCPPTLPKWLKMRKLQREAASEKSGSPWISGASLCDFLGLDLFLQLGGNHGAKSLHRTWATKLRVLEVSTRRFTIRFQPLWLRFHGIHRFKGSAILTLLVVGLIICAIWCVLWACEVLGGTRVARSKSSCLNPVNGRLPASKEKLCRRIQLAQNGKHMEPPFVPQRTRGNHRARTFSPAARLGTIPLPSKIKHFFSWVSAFVGYIWGMPKSQKKHLAKDTSTNSTRTRQAWNFEGNLNQLVSTIQIPCI